MDIKSETGSAELKLELVSVMFSTIEVNVPEINPGIKCSAREIIQKIVAFFLLSESSSGVIRSVAVSFWLAAYCGSI